MTSEGRRARQRKEIRALVAAGDRARAEALAREHLVSFPEDQSLFVALLDISVERLAPE